VISRLQEVLPHVIIAEARVFSNNQRRILLPEDTLHIGLSNSRKTQPFVKDAQYIVCVIHNLRSPEAVI